MRDLITARVSEASIVARVTRLFGGDVFICLRPMQSPLAADEILRTTCDVHLVRTQSSKVDRRSSPTFFKRSLAILPSPNDPERDPLMFLQIGPLHVIVRRLAPASRPSSTFKCGTCGLCRRSTFR